MLSALSVGQGFSPLDEELALLPGTFTPSLQESVVRLATWMPFLPAGQMIKYFTKVDISEPTVRRITEKAGQAYVEIQTAQVERLERELPEAPDGPDVQLMSVDGAMVPLVHREWAEVKTLALGTVKEPVLKEGEWEIHTEELSYFSRLADSDTFARLATVETHRRGTEKAGEVCGVVDGADWEQKFIDLHRPDAKRILDWGHAAEYVAKAGQAGFGAGTGVVSEWLGVQLHELKHGDPQKVLSELRRLLDRPEAQGESSLSSEVKEVVRSSLEYLEKRQEQIRYAAFIAAGYPIGSGAVESANKLVVEARLKGAGMHWTRENVNPMVALRTIACSDRWEEAWPQISEQVRQKAKERSESRQVERLRIASVTLEGSLATKQEREVESCNALADVQPIATCEPCELAVSLALPATYSVASVSSEAKTNGGRRPAANHPWRNIPIGQARFRHLRQGTSAES